MKANLVEECMPVLDEMTASGCEKPHYFLIHIFPLSDTPFLEGTFCSFLPKEHTAKNRNILLEVITEQFLNNIKDEFFYYYFLKKDLGFSYQRI